MKLRSFALAFLCSCCISPTSPDSYTSFGAQRIRPVPETFYPAFAEMAVCVGDWAVPGRTFSKIRWLEADSIFKGDIEYGGFWNQDTFSITLSKANLRNGDWDLRIVQHESLHHLLWPRFGHGTGRFHECDPLWWLHGAPPPGKSYWEEVM